MSTEIKPPAHANAPLDSLIVSAATTEWRKVAMLIAGATDACKAAAVEASSQVIAARIYALVESGQLEARGNVRRWRAGEVRAPVPASR